MVKVSSGREDIKHSFGENIGVVSILRGKGDFVLLSGNGKLGGKSGLLDMFVIKRDGLFYPVDPGVVLRQPRHSQDYLGTSQPYNHKG